MRRFIAFLLISLMALQTSWAAVTTYCQHEQGSAARHVGHHEHHHHDKSLVSAADKDTSHATPTVSVDLDCSFCHAGCTLALLLSSDVDLISIATIDLAYSLVLHPPSVPTDPPERPNWS
jgi:hypothetical protein